ncbi:hypothetical protein BpHYR1_017074 [Brachionus plicatilis]|uniref:Uncharacterized protein n=1 Tax=Brachionus plicatilis TaxID=10195 RepID=A0A3M7RQ47_BRAPC|nr:hypothetical protein BpHYR1_017074 [Brachionus plicatilis]
MFQFNEVEVNCSNLFLIMQKVSKLKFNQAYTVDSSNSFLNIMKNVRRFIMITQYNLMNNFRLQNITKQGDILSIMITKK